MEPLHPPEYIELKAALYILAILFGALAVQIALGYWDELVSQAVPWFPIWTWGG